MMTEKRGRRDEKKKGIKKKEKNGGIHGYVK